MNRIINHMAVLKNVSSAMIPDPDSWPLWPLLPLKNRKITKDGMGKLGYLKDMYIRGKYQLPYKVYGGNIYMPQTSDPVIGTYNSLEEMFDAGWYVD